MKPGAQISGHVAEAGLLTSLSGIEGCALDPASTPRAEEFERCAFTDPAGDYTIRSLREGAFIVVFSRQRGPIDDDGFIPQWWDGVPTAAEATPIALSPPQIRTGIDADLVESARPRPLPHRDGDGPPTLIWDPPQEPRPHCKRHFRKRMVKGKPRCVRVHRNKHRRGAARPGGLPSRPDGLARHGLGPYGFNLLLAQRVRPDAEGEPVWVVSGLDWLCVFTREGPSEGGGSAYGKGLVGMARE